MGDIVDRDVEPPAAADAARELQAAHEQIEHLQQALETRSEIGTAIGILMVQQKVGRASAFRLLSGASQRSNVKLRDVAARVVAVEDERHKHP